MLDSKGYSIISILNALNAQKHPYNLKKYVECLRNVYFKVANTLHKSLTRVKNPLKS